MNEFELISSCFNGSTVARDDVILGIGDDAALVAFPPRGRLHSATAFVEPDVNHTPQRCANQLFEQTTASLLAEGAVPHWATLALSLQQRDHPWCIVFAQTLSHIAQRYSVTLIGGDTTASELSALLTVHGYQANLGATTTHE